MHSGQQYAEQSVIQHLCKAAQRGTVLLQQCPDFCQLASIPACALVSCSGCKGVCRELEQLMRKTSGHTGVALHFSKFVASTFAVGASSMSFWAMVAGPLKSLYTF